MTCRFLFFWEDDRESRASKRDVRRYVRSLDTPLQQADAQGAAVSIPGIVAALFLRRSFQCVGSITRRIYARSAASALARLCFAVRWSTLASRWLLYGSRPVASSVANKIHPGLVSFLIDPPGIQMHAFPADGLKMMFHL
jgi:hypothetical protein